MYNFLNKKGDMVVVHYVRKLKNTIIIPVAVELPHNMHIRDGYDNKDVKLIGLWISNEGVIGYDAGEVFHCVNKVFISEVTSKITISTTPIRFPHHDPSVMRTGVDYRHKDYPLARLRFCNEMEARIFIRMSKSERLDYMSKGKNLDENNTRNKVTFVNSIYLTTPVSEMS